MARRASTLLLGLVALLVGAAPAAAEENVTVAMQLPANNGLYAKLEASGEDGVELEFRDERRVAFYSTAEDGYDAAGIDLAFGRLGRFQAEFRPTETTAEFGPPRGCRGKPGTNQVGWFVGDFEFRGERGFVRIDAERVKGRLRVTDWECSARRSLAAESEQATITAISPDRRHRLLVFGSRGEDGADTGFIALAFERREGMKIARYAYASSGRAGLRFDNAAGTALVEPPFPFNGRARFTRHPNGHNAWAGSLNVPLLGAGRVHFAGPGYRARMKPELPEFE